MSWEGNIKQHKLLYDYIKGHHPDLYKNLTQSFEVSPIKDRIIGVKNTIDYIGIEQYKIIQIYLGLYHTEPKFQETITLWIPRLKEMERLKKLEMI